MGMERAGKMQDRYSLETPSGNGYTSVQCILYYSVYVILFSHKKNQSSFEKQLISELGQVIHKIHLEHLVIPESNEVL